VQNNRQNVSRNGNQISPAEAGFEPVPSCQSLGGARSHTANMGTGGADSQGICISLHPSHPRRPVGGQASLGLFGVSDRCHREHASSLILKAPAQEEGAPQQPAKREGVREQGIRQLRELRQALAAQQVEAPIAPAAPERQLFGMAAAIAEIPRNPRAAREAACQSVARSNRVREAFLAKGSPLTPEEVEAAANPQPSASPSAGIWASPRTCKDAAALPPSTRRSAPLFGEEAEVEYEAHLAEVAEARSHQLDEEADRYACCFAGAGYTEFLMACEG
jgi:hypothetical protein